MDPHGEERCPQDLDAERKARISELNDRFRRDRKGGYFCFTNGVRALGYERSEELLRAIAAFDKFTADNDPHREHDFGALTFGGERYFWKIDYYDSSQTYASPDPADESATIRILTVMRASEY
jgi:hypothetical protein